MKVIIDWKLNTGFHRIYNWNIYPLILDAFPLWDIKPWELKRSRVPRSYWTNEAAAEATKWLIEENLDWSLEQVSRQLAKSSFFKNNLGE